MLLSPSQNLVQSAQVLQTSVFCCHPLSPWYSLPKSCIAACSTATLSEPGTVCTVHKSCSTARSADTLLVPGTVCSSPANQRVLLPPSQSLVQSAHVLPSSMFYCLPFSPWYSLPNSCRTACSAATLSVPGTVCPSPADQRVLLPPSHSLAQSAQVLQTSMFCCLPPPSPSMV